MGTLKKLTILWVAMLLGCTFSSGAVIVTETQDTVVITEMLRKAQRWVLQPNRTRKDNDSAILIANKALAMSVNSAYIRGEAQSYLLLTQAYNYQGNNLRRAATLEQAIASFKKISYWPGLAEATYLKATYSNYVDSAQLVYKIGLEKEALFYFQKSGNNLRIAECYQQLGDHYSELTDHKLSLQMLNMALVFYKKAQTPGVQGVYSLIGLHYNVAGNYQEAVKYGLMAIETGQALKDSSEQMIVIYNRVSLNYNSMKDFLNGSKYGKMGMEIAKRNKDINTLYMLSDNVAYSLSNLKRYNEAINLLKQIEKEFPNPDKEAGFSLGYRYLNIYLDNGSMEKARPYAEAMIKMSGKPPATIGDYAHWFFSISRFYLLTKQYHKTLEFISRYMPADNELMAYQRLIVYQRKFRADSALGHYQDALNEHILYKTLSDSLFNEKKSQQIEQLNVKFETKNRNRELILQKKQLQLQEARFERSETVRNLFFYLTGGLLLMAGLLVSLFRMKVSKNRELMVRQKVIDRKNEKLELLVNEKEWLLKEVHHRVKNNLQIVISLLNSQSTYLKDSAAFDAIQDSQARINSMAMIHLKLYKSYNTLSIDLPDYIKELVNYFKASYIAGKQVEFRLELTPLLTDVSIAVPLALILNEAITNSLKHAFPDRGDGIIVITLKTGTGSEMEMAIADNGVGLSPGFDMEHQTSLGINLIRGLSGDIEGKCVIDGSNGTTVLVIFGNEIPNRTLQ